MSIVTNIYLKSSDRLAGIYEIRCSADDKVYVGQSINLYQRKIDHFKVLRKHKEDRKKPRHHCRHLQSAFNIYPEDTFSFNVVFILDEDLVARINDDEVVKIALQPLEQIYMNKHHKKMMFNSAPAAASTAGVSPSEEHKKATGEANKKNYRCYSPEIGYIEFRGLKDFCVAKGFSAGAFSAMLRGVSKTSHGFFRSEEDYQEWKNRVIVYNRPDGFINFTRVYADFEIFSPDLGVVKSNGRSQAQMERDYNIPANSISMLFAGVTRYTGGFFLSEKDYHQYIEDRGLSVYHPIEGELKIFKVVDFCKDRNLNFNGICDVLYKETISHQGYFKNKDVYEKTLAKSSKWSSKYTGVERISVNCWRFKIFKGGKVIYQESGNVELEVALRCQVKRKEFGLPEVPLLRMDKLLGKKTTQEAA